MPQRLLFGFRRISDISTVQFIWTTMLPAGVTGTVTATVRGMIGGSYLAMLLWGFMVTLFSGGVILLFRIWRLVEADHQAVGEVERFYRKREVERQVQSRLDLERLDRQGRSYLALWANMTGSNKSSRD